MDMDEAQFEGFPEHLVGVNGDDGEPSIMVVGASGQHTFPFISYLQEKKQADHRTIAFENTIPQLFTIGEPFPIKQSKFVV